MINKFKKKMKIVTKKNRAATSIYAKQITTASVLKPKRRVLGPKILIHIFLNNIFNLEAKK
jgi:hypothetical protein